MATIPDAANGGGPGGTSQLPKPTGTGPEFYDAWRAWTAQQTGFTGSRLTEATRANIAAAGGGGGSTGPTGPTGPTPTGPAPTAPTAPTTPTGPTNPFSAVQLMEGFLFQTLGITGLGEWAANLSNQGASPTEIVQALRYGIDKSAAGQAAYAAYLKAFPMMDQFLRDGIFAGEAPELQYIQYRNTVKDAAQRYGINASLVTNDKIASYIAGRNSAVEIVDRMNMAATAVATTPPETIAVMRDYYGINSGDLISFYLNPDETEAELTMRYTAARIGTEAARQRFGVSKQEAESLAQRGVNVGQAQEGFGQAARQTVFIDGLGETATRADIFSAAFGDEAAIQKVTRIAQSKTGRFQEGGGYATNQAGIAGLGSSTTR